VVLGAVQRFERSLHVDRAVASTHETDLTAALDAFWADDLAKLRQYRAQHVAFGQGVVAPCCRDQLVPRDRTIIVDDEVPEQQLSLTSRQFGVQPHAVGLERETAAQLDAKPTHRSSKVVTRLAQYKRAMLHPCARDAPRRRG
jgi:hypothetical protein